MADLRTSLDAFFSKFGDALKSGTRERNAAARDLEQKAFRRLRWERTNFSKNFSNLTRSTSELLGDIGTAVRSDAEAFDEWFRKGQIERERRLQTSIDTVSSELNKYVRSHGRWVTAEQVASDTQSGSPSSTLLGVYRKPTLEEVSLFAYGDSKYVELIKSANSIEYTPSGQVTNTQFWCPPIVEDSSTPLSAIPEAAPLPKGFIAKGAWVARERAVAEETLGLAVIIFPRGSQETLEPPSYRVLNMTSFSCRASLFEASRAVEVTWPSELNSDPSVNLYGNHVVCAYNGEVFFMGVLVAPKVLSNKGITTTWLAQSHTYTAITTHFNPQSVIAEYSSLLPLEALYSISFNMQIPMIVPGEARELLRYDNSDEEGVKAHHDQDVMGTTPMKTIQRIIAPAGLYATANEEGTLVIDKVDINRPIDYVYIEGDPERGQFDLEVRYNYGELARTYTVLSQRRTKGVSQADYDQFPLAIFRNVVRQGADKSNTEVAEFEASKSLARAVNIDMTVPEWENPGTRRLWKTGEVIKVLSPTYGLAENYSDGDAVVQYPLALVVSSVTFEHTKDWKRTRLGLSLPGVFDTSYPRIIPFLTAPDEAFTVTSKEIDVDIQTTPNLEEGVDENAVYNEDYE